MANAGQVALLRGINVGGRNSLPMAELVAIMCGLGLANVRTYIQSGNVVFDGDGSDAEQLGEQISRAIEAKKGFAPRVMVVPGQAVLDAIAGNPFPDGEAEPKTLHVAFLAAPAAAPDLERLQALAGPREAFELRHQVFYLHAPDGIGRSRLAAAMERALGMPTTSRNWRTVTKIADMLGAPT